MRHHEPAEAGFTLTELLVTLTIVGVLGAATVGMLVRQNGFYTRTGDLQYANQSVRGTADLVASELRAVSGEDILHSRSDSLRVRYDVRQALVCRTSGSTVDFFVFGGSGNTNLPAGRGTAYREPFAAQYEEDDAFDAYAASNPHSDAEDNCIAAGAPDDAPSDRYRRVDWSGASTTAPTQGSYLRVYGFLSYHFDPSGFGNGSALWRNGDELVGPLAPNGVEFTYRVCPPSSSCSWKSNVTDNSEKRSIERLRVRATAVGEGNNRYDVEHELWLEVPLRN